MYNLYALKIHTWYCVIYVWSCFGRFDFNVVRAFGLNRTISYFQIQQVLRIVRNYCIIFRLKKCRSKQMHSNCIICGSQSHYLFLTESNPYWTHGLGKQFSLSNGDTSTSNVVSANKSWNLVFSISHDFVKPCHTINVKYIDPPMLDYALALKNANLQESHFKIFEIYF